MVDVGSLAGLGGTLLATLNGLSLGLSDIGLVAFPVIVLGGLTSLSGAVVAGLLLGIFQAFTDGILTPLLRHFFAPTPRSIRSARCSRSCPYMILVFVLLVRPQGIFGRRGTERL